MCSTSGGASRQLTETITALALAAPNSSSKNRSLDLVEMGDARLRRDAFGDQRVGDLARGAVERGVGGGAAVMDDGRRIGLLRAPWMRTISARPAISMRIILVRFPWRICILAL